MTDTGSLRHSASVPASLTGLRVLVLGLGRFGGGVGVTRWLVRRGAEVTVTDRAGADSLAESIEALSDMPVTLHLGGHDPGDLKGTDLVVVNPAVCKRSSHFFQLITRRGIPWTTELNLFCERCPGRVIGVTGTYGKSTTSAMLASALKACSNVEGARHTRVYLGGNIGGSLLSELEEMQPTDLVVLEMSGAQLEDLPRIDRAPCIAAITNLSPHHLERYGSYARYLDAKLNILKASTPPAKIIVGNLDPQAESKLQSALDHRRTRLVRVIQPRPTLELRLPGEHNRLNAACALTVCHELGADEAAARNALRSFRGLPHRLEYVRTIDGVDYYDDSKSTSPAVIVTSVASLCRPIVAIVGGQEVFRSAGSDKGVCKDGERKSWEDDLRSCAGALARACRMVICTGESALTFARAIRRVEGSNRPEAVKVVDGLAQAVQIARRAAHPGDAVLFSPGAPSFDSYANFAQRGRHFVELVNAAASAPRA